MRTSEVNYQIQGHTAKKREPRHQASSADLVELTPSISSCVFITCDNVTENIQMLKKNQNKLFGQPNIWVVRIFPPTVPTNQGIDSSGTSKEVESHPVWEP